MTSKTLRLKQIKQIEDLLGIDNLKLLIAIDGERKQNLFYSEEITATPIPSSTSLEKSKSMGLSENCFPVLITVGGLRQKIMICP